jgi:hypothetical protein
MITITPDRNHTVKIGDQHYRPILIKVENKQNIPEDLDDTGKALIAEYEDEQVKERFNSAINEHVVIKGRLKDGHLYTRTVELMILKPIKNGR